MTKQKAEIGIATFQDSSSHPVAPEEGGREREEAWRKRLLVRDLSKMPVTAFDVVGGGGEGREHGNCKSKRARAQASISECERRNGKTVLSD